MAAQTLGPSLRAETLYKKQQGMLRLAQDTLSWTPASGTTATLLIPLATVKSQMQSPAHAAKVGLKLIVQPRSTNLATVDYTFTYTSSKALQERDAFRDAVANATVAGAGLDNALPPSVAKPATSGRSNTPPSLALRPITNLSLVQEIKLRADLLRQHRSLARLHQELVRNGHVAEQEFWESRKHLLQSAALQGGQKRGQSSAWLADVRPETDKNGEIKFTLTPQRIQSIFLQVEFAYKQNVPDKISEQDFWRRYFQSQFFHRTRGKAMFQETAKDELFDKCIEEEQQALAPNKRLKLHRLHQTLNLEATIDDKLDDNGNAPDQTMRHADESVPIVRRFNRHSELVLRALRSEQAPLPSLPPIEEEIKLDDLTMHIAIDAFPLQLSSQQQYHETRLNEQAHRNGVNNNQKGNESSMDELEQEMSVWIVPLGQHLNIDCLQNIARQLSLQTTHRRHGKRDAEQLEEEYPPGLLVKLKSLQSTGNELLRHFWASVNGVTQEKRAKSRRMVEALQNLISGRCATLKADIETFDTTVVIKTDLFKMLAAIVEPYQRVIL